MGQVWAGYRGELPPWAAKADRQERFHELKLSESLVVRFLKLDYAHHFTFYKPDFMSLLFTSYCPEADSLFYFDPDIVLKCRWQHFEDWARFGVALCEDLISPVNRYSPLRSQWKAFCAASGFTVHHELDIYINGGFIGVLREWQSFLKLWSDIQRAMPISFDSMEQFPDRNSPFQRTDQDALNIAAMCTSLPISVQDRAAMDFAPYGEVMSHAVGNPKPWRKSFIQHSLKGLAPSRADWQFFKHISEPIDVFPGVNSILKRTDLYAGLAIAGLIRKPVPTNF